MSIPAPSLIRFGVFEVDLGARELRKRGIKIKIQGQPFDVLATLLARPGQLVTREQLKASIWAGETFVDFDLGLNKAVNRIREALGDTAATPRFIETLARRGYRFIAPVEAPLASSDSPLLLRSSLLPPQNTSFLPNHFAISPDGRRLAFVAVDSNRKEALWVRDLATAGTQQLTGTQSARLPFWRPDSRQIGFFAEGKLKTIDIAGGAVRTLCDARVGGGGAWHSDDIIVFAGHISGPLHRVPATGGTPVPVTPPPPADSGQLHSWPVFLPESDRFLYFVNRAGPAGGLGKGLYSGSISSMEAHLVSAEIGGNVAFAAGHLCFVKDGGLSAQPFNPESLWLSGDPVAIAPHEMEVWETVFFHSAFSVSETGILVFQSRTDFARELVWMDASGNDCGRIPGGYWEPHVSPDGRFVAVTSDEFRDGKWFICVHDLERGVTTKLTNGGHEWHPSWSDDGKRIQYDSLQGDVSSICEIAADGSGLPQVLVEFGLVAHCSRDGALVFARLLRGTPHLMIRLPGSKETIEWGPGVEPRFSPDGQWIAFTEYGGAGICVRSFPGPGPRIQISSGPGAQPRWSGDGTQLYYVAADKTLMAVSFDAHTGRTGPPRGLFQTRIVRASLIAWQYDAVSDGRFLINSLRAGSPPLTLLTGYTSLLKSRRE
ncbi:MAG: PD40 domain-containing protein [Bryobacterales bacterium]|nr:PD40 domain-containing protein [Bryobacterales bacterium]